VKLKVLLFVGLKTSPFLENPKGTVTFRIPPEIEEKLIQENTIEKKSIIKIKL
jgi:hypothetical protein